MAGGVLSWFWQPWFFQRGFPDLAIAGLTNDNMLVIGKKGLLPVPVDIKIVYGHGLEDEILKDMWVWADGTKVFELQLPSDKNTGYIRQYFLVGFAMKQIIIPEKTGMTNN